MLRSSSSLCTRFSRKLLAILLLSCIHVEFCESVDGHAADPPIQDRTWEPGSKGRLPEAGLDALKQVCNVDRIRKVSPNGFFLQLFPVLVSSVRGLS